MVRMVPHGACRTVLFCTYALREKNTEMCGGWDRPSGRAAGGVYRAIEKPYPYSMPYKRTLWE